MEEFFHIQIKQNDKIEVLELNSFISDEDELIYLQTQLNSKTYGFVADNYFEALQKLRLEAEKKDIQLLCNGAALNVYPSPMMLSMGEGRKAYKLTYVVPAKKLDILDIFEYDPALKMATVDKQNDFYEKWLESL